MPVVSASRQFGMLLLLWLAGVCLRVTVLAIPPVVPLLHVDLHLSETGIGWLSSLPPMLFAIAAVPGSLLIARLGLVPALLIGLLLNAFGSAARGAIAQVPFLYGATMVMAAGISITQPTLPPLVRAWFPDRAAFATAVYMNGLLLGEILAVSLTIPVVLPLVHESWRWSFVVWSAPVLVTALLFACCAPRGAVAKPEPDAAPAVSRAEQARAQAWWPDWRQPVIWRLGLILGSVNATYFVSNAFLPDYVTAAGRPDLISSALAAINIGQLPASFLALAFADRLVTRPSAYIAAALLSLLSVLGMIFMRGDWIVVWSGVLGFTNATTLILAFALPSMLSAPDEVHRISAGMFTISYGIAMSLSVLGGWLWDATRLPAAGFAPIVLCGLVIVALSSTVRRSGSRPGPA